MLKVVSLNGFETHFAIETEWTVVFVPKMVFYNVFKTTAEAMRAAFTIIQIKSKGKLVRKINNQEVYHMNECYYIVGFAGIRGTGDTISAASKAAGLDESQWIKPLRLRKAT